jgi:RNA polymerase sigma-70 factor (ECF subfamily)
MHWRMSAISLSRFAADRAPAGEGRNMRRVGRASLWQEGEEPSPLSDADPLPPEDRLIPAVEAVCIETLYRDHSPRLLRSISRKMASREEAHDLVHDIFLRIARLGASGPLRLHKAEAYLSRMATNLLRDRARTEARHHSDRHVTADEEFLAGADQQKHLESRDMLRRMEAAMLKLRPITREIFMAHRLDGLSYLEIADRTGLSVKGVEKHMSKAIAQITRSRRRA